MDWTAAVDNYCERLGPAFWAEPVNAVTNGAFLIAALWVWPRTKGAGRLLAGVLFAIGVGSFLFHTFAQPWAALADVLPILAFILVYIFLANRDFWGLGRAAALVGTALLLPYAIVTGRAFGTIPGLGGSAGYAPVALLIFLYAIALRRRTPDTARGLAIGAAILVVSLTARTLDAQLCVAVPVGTHFLWHVLNAIMLGWMILVWQRHRDREGRRAGLAGGGAGR